MTKEEMIEGFNAGRTMVQEYTSLISEIDAVNQLAKEGLIILSPWVRTRHEPQKIRIAWPVKKLEKIGVKQIEQS